MIFNFKSVNILKNGNPSYLTEGCNSGQLRNEYWIVKNKDNSDSNPYVVMEIKDNNGDDVHTLFSTESLDRILNLNDYRPTYYLAQTGYVAFSQRRGKKYKHIPKLNYLHQLILGYYGNGKGQNSIDHINQFKYDNRLSNLRITTQSIQNSNRPKRTRNKNAKSLPEGITQEMIPKYVVYYKERSYIKGRTKENDSHREFFKIEKHPLLKPTKSGKKIWIGSKSMKIPILEKLEQVKQKLEEINV
jgi:hypothetical protein